MFHAGHHPTAVAGLLPCIAFTMVSSMMRLNMYLRQSLRAHVPNAKMGRRKSPSAPGRHSGRVVRRFIRRYASYGSYRSQIKERSQTGKHREDGSLAVCIATSWKERIFRRLQRHHPDPAFDGYRRVTVLKITPYCCPSLIISRIASFGLSGPTLIGAANDQFFIDSHFLEMKSVTNASRASGVSGWGPPLGVFRQCWLHRQAATLTY